MPAFRPDIAVLALLALFAGIRTAVPAEAAPPPSDLDIIVDAAGIEIDSEANRLRMPKVEIRQGKMLIRADEALAKGVEASFRNTEWEFRGSVHIEFDGGKLDAARATAKFVGNKLESALATGSPATFSHQLKGSERRNSGRANSIEYDVKRGRMRMAGKAWYTDGRSEFTTEGIVYNLANRAIESEPGSRPRQPCAHAYPR